MRFNPEITWTTLITGIGLMGGLFTWLTRIQPRLENIQNWIHDHAAACIRRENAQTEREKSLVVMATEIASLASTVQLQGEHNRELAERVNRWIDNMSDRRQAPPRKLAASLSGEV